MKQKTAVFAVLTAALTMSVGCGGLYAPAGSEGTGGSAGSGGASGASGNGGAGGSTGGAVGTGGSTVGSGGATGGSGGGAGGAGGSMGGSGGSTGGAGGSTGGSGGSTGGTGGGAGKGGTGGSGGTDVPGTIRCGTSICTPITAGPIGVLQPCCPMDTANACGGISPFGCLTTTPGMANSRCPTVSVMGISLPGCCRPNGMCGVNLQVVSLGCNDPVLVGGMPASSCR
jgi:hypothetical protein